MISKIQSFLNLISVQLNTEMYLRRVKSRRFYCTAVKYFVALCILFLIVHNLLEIAETRASVPKNNKPVKLVEFIKNVKTDEIVTQGGQDPNPVINERREFVKQVRKTRIFARKLNIVYKFLVHSIDDGRRLVKLQNVRLGLQRTVTPYRSGLARRENFRRGQHGCKYHRLA